MLTGIENDIVGTIMEDFHFEEINCLKCVYFINLTESEKRIIHPKLVKFQIIDKSCIGACLLPEENPTLLVRRYLEEIDKKCVFFRKGFYREKIGIPCPICKVGNLVVTRPLINGHPVIIIGCDRFPDCRHSIHKVQLLTNCRFCNMPLTLVAGDILRCFCEKCHRGTGIPVSIKSWPWLIPTRNGCVHSTKENICLVCNQSKEEKINLLDLELPNMSKLVQQRRSENFNRFEPDLQKELQIDDSWLEREKIDYQKNDHKESSSPYKFITDGLLDIYEPQEAIYDYLDYVKSEEEEWASFMRWDEE